MRRLLASTALLALLLGLGAGGGDALAGKLRGSRRIKRLNQASNLQGNPIAFPDGAATCDLGIQLPPGLELPLPADLLNVEVFDPSLFSEIAVAGDGRVLAYAAPPIAAGFPVGAKDIVLLPEGSPSVRVTEGAGNDDQPHLSFDADGLRMVWRGFSAATDDAPADIFLRGIRKDAEATRNITRVSVTTDVNGSGTCYDPVIAARIRTIEVGGGIKLRQRDARVAFVSTADLDTSGRALPATTDRPGRNPDGEPQLFVWYEKLDRFFQVTRIDEEGHEVNRPAISASGKIVVFECTADLTPDAVSPNDSLATGNPDGVRQLYRWVQGRGLEQLTWSDRDCFSPRMDQRGRVVYFSSTGDLVAGGNPERNSEIFRWRSRGRPSRRLRQVTARTMGDSVLPRPTANGTKFAFYSTAHVEDAFGTPQLQCLPLAYSWARGKVQRIHGLTDAENIVLVTGEVDVPVQNRRYPVLTGPPVPGVSLTKVQFATNDPLVDPPPGRDSDGLPTPPAFRSSLAAFHVARSTRYRRGSAVTGDQPVTPNTDDSGN